MNISCKFISEYVHNNTKLDETRKIVEDTLDEYERRHGYHLNRIVNVLCISKLLNKTKNETENIHFESFNINVELNKILQTSQGSRKTYENYWSENHD